jgi:transcription termination factor Rho
MSPDQLRRVWVLRKVLDQMSTVEAMELLLDRLRKSVSNADFLDQMAA